MASPDHKRCLGCGYILDHLPEPRCPECGRGFDPKDDTTYFVGLRSGRSLLIWAILGAAVIAALLASSLVQRLSRQDVVDMPSIGSMMTEVCVLLSIWLGSGALEAYVLYASIRAVRRSPHRLLARRAWFAAAVISALSLCAFIATVTLQRVLRLALGSGNSMRQANRGAAASARTASVAPPGLIIR
jgi:hypothetical protein